MAQLAAAMPVDIMAGAADPANQALPQQALHACLFAHAAAYPALHRRAASAPACRESCVSLCIILHHLSLRSAAWANSISLRLQSIMLNRL